MKRILMLLLLTGLPVIGLMAQTATPKNSDEATEVPVNGPKATWNTIVNDMGEVQYMVSKDAEFKVTNSGTQPLLLTSARASCGCTNLKYSKEPILPGQSSTISVTFNGSGSGAFRKTITVQTNETEKSTTVLQIAGTVVKTAQ